MFISSSRVISAVIVVSCGLAGSAALAQTPVASSAAVPTFAKDIAPILYKNCTACHRAGEIAPMSLMTYAETRPWARSIRDRVSRGLMPPWHAEAPVHTFENERRLTELERDTLLRWVDGGTPEGNPMDRPEPPAYPYGWTIGKPDVVLEMLEDYKVPANGVVNYEYFYVPTHFTEPKYVQALEVRPGNRAMLHHAQIFHMAKPDTPRAPVTSVDEARQRLPPSPPGLRLQSQEDTPVRLVAVYAPGMSAQIFKAGKALRLEPGGVLEFQMHYTPTGTAGTDRTQLGLIFSRDAAPDEMMAESFYNGIFALPAGASNVRVDADMAFQEDALLWGLFPHTHLRAKKWEYRVELPDGTERVILSVPTYDFNWQTYYMFREPVSLPRGSRIHSSAWYDNSAANPSNPDPSVVVHWGDQTSDEMQYTALLFSLTPSMAKP